VVRGFARSRSRATSFRSWLDGGVGVDIPAISRSSSVESNAGARVLSDGGTGKDGDILGNQWSDATASTLNGFNSIWRVVHLTAPLWN
jgi:hypothetical protein